MKRKIRVDLEERDSLGWMVSFSDVVTLLITFFVLIIAMSSMDQKVIRKSFTYFSGAPGILGEENSGSKNLVYFMKKYNFTKKDFKRYMYIINRYKLKEVQAVNILKLEKILGEGYNYDIEDKNIILKINSNKIFLEYDTMLTQKGEEFLKKLYKIMKLFSGKLIVEIYSSKFPVKTTTIKNNVDLSIKRCEKIASFLEKKGISPYRLSIIGWGDRKIKKDLAKIILKNFLKI